MPGGNAGGNWAIGGGTVGGLESGFFYHLSLNLDLINSFGRFKLG